MPSHRTGFLDDDAPDDFPATPAQSVSRVILPAGTPFQPPEPPPYSAEDMPPEAQAPATRKKRSQSGQNRPQQPKTQTAAPPNGAHTPDALPTAGNPILYDCVSAIPAKAIRWLWPGRLARGKINIIVGNPGLGKSQVCASVASVVSVNGKWPVDRTQCEGGKVVILSAEDDAADTIRPRLEAANADLNKIYILKAVRDGFNSNGVEAVRGFDILRDISALIILMHEIGDVALVIIDPITAYLGSTETHNNAEVRAALAPLADAAALCGATILAVSHLTKGGGVDALMRVQGSVAFAAAARAVWGVCKDKDNPSRRLFLPLKNNLGTDSTGFAYQIEGYRLDNGDEDIETSRVIWEAESISVNADEAFSNPNIGNEEMGALDDAKQFLRDMLSDGPVSVKQIKMDADGAGHSWATIRRAQAALKADAYKEGMKGGWHWRLPAKPLRYADQ